jgi:hypothetical protein
MFLIVTALITEVLPVSRHSMKEIHVSPGIVNDFNLGVNCDKKSYRAMRAKCRVNGRSTANFNDDLSLLPSIINVLRLASILLSFVLIVRGRFLRQFILPKHFLIIQEGPYPSA